MNEHHGSMCWLNVVIDTWLLVQWNGQLYKPDTGSKTDKGNY